MKVLHISFHRGCQNDIEYVMDCLGHDLTFMTYDDGISHGADKYNVTAEKATASWNKHKDFYNTFDVILTSDTAPISRVFLQNGWPSKTKHLIVWICNRFDYCDVASQTAPFPDKAYYTLLQNAYTSPYVTFIGYTLFEQWYAKNVRNVDLGHLCIQPIGKIGQTYASFTPTTVENKSNTLFVGPYHNDNIMMDLSKKLHSLGISTYNGRYNGPLDLAEFKGVIHIPYAWSNLALFEALQAGIIYYIPSLPFLKKMVVGKNFFWSPPLKWDKIHLSDWYSTQFESMFVYFDSWDDLVQKLDSVDPTKHTQNMAQLAQTHNRDMLKKWTDILR